MVTNYLYKEQLLPICTKNGYSLNAQRLVTTLVPTCRSNLGLKPGARKTLGLSWPGERMGFRLCCCSSCSHTWRSALHMKSLSIVMTKVSTTYEIPVYHHDKGQHYIWNPCLSSWQRSALHMKSLSIVMTKVSTTYEIPVYRHDKGQHYIWNPCLSSWQRSALHMKSLSIVMTKVSTTYEIPVYHHDKGQHYKYKGTLSSFSHHEHKTHAKRPQATDSWRLEPSQPQRSYHGKTAQKHCNTNSKRRK